MIFSTLLGNAKFVNKGFISLPYNANKNATFEGVSIRPNFANLENSGTIEIGAFKHSDNKIENTQILTKTATFEKGSKMQVDVVAGSKAFVKGDKLEQVISAANSLTINELKVNSATLEFEEVEVKPLTTNSNVKYIDLVVSKVNAFEEAGNRLTAMRGLLVYFTRYQKETSEATKLAAKEELDNFMEERLAYLN